MNKLLKKILTDEEARDLDKLRALAETTPDAGDPWAPEPANQ